MDNKQLSALISNNLPDRCKKEFWGCLTVDELSQLVIPVRHNPIYIIVNILTKKELKKMGHWVLIYIQDATIYFLDSYGVHPTNYSPHFNTFLRNHKLFALWTQNRQLQSTTSHICGAYVLFFMHMICHRGINFLTSTLSKSFRHSPATKNDRVVLQRVYKEYQHMPHCIDTFCLNRYTYKECIFYLCNGLG